MLNNIYFVSTTSSVLLSLSIALLAGLLMSRVVKIFKLPAVTAYLIAGIIVGPFLLGSFNIDGLGITKGELGGLKILCELALGFIAFAMGNEFRLKELKEIGKNATIIGICQALFTTIVVDAALIGLHFLIPDKFSLEAALDYINNDELVEVTPLSFRMRKRILNTSERKKYDSYVQRGEE